MVKNPPTGEGDTWNTVQSLGWEDPLEEGMATHSSVLAWRIPWTEGLVGCSSWGHQDSDLTEATEHSNRPGLEMDMAHSS